MFGFFYEQSLDSWTTWTGPETQFSVKILLFWLYCWHITHQTSKHGFVAIQCASINVLPTFFLYVRFYSRVHLKCEFQVPYSNLNIIRHATKLWLEMNQTILMAVYNHFWPFLTICIFSQNWDSDGHFEVLNESKSWLLQISWHISVVSKNSLNSCYFSAS